MTDYAGFIYGGTSFPLTADTTNSLLYDADRSLYHLLDFCASVLTTHLGDRIVAQAAVVGADQIVAAVSDKVPWDPTPYLTEDHLKFPLLYAFRTQSEFADRTVTFLRQVTELNVGWILPPLRVGEAEALLPLLHAASVVLAQRLDQARDPAFTPTGSTAGTPITDPTVSNIEKLQTLKASFGAYKPTEKLVYPSVTLTVQLRERFELKLADFDTFDGIDYSIDLTSIDGTQVTDFAQVNTAQEPVLLSVSPTSGTKAGGTSVTLTGTGFREGTTPLVLFGGAYADNVVVVDDETITCVSPAYPAYPTTLADIDVQSDDGDTTLSDAYSFVTP